MFDDFLKINTGTVVVLFSQADNGDSHTISSRPWESKIISFDKANRHAEEEGEKAGMAFLDTWSHPNHDL